MTDPSMMWIADAMAAGEIEVPALPFREALALLQADYGARCETCAHHSTMFVALGRVYCFQLDIDMPVDAVCCDWMARP